MRRVGTTEVVLTRSEAQAHTRFTELLDFGHNIPTAAETVGSEFGMSDDFVSWLQEG